LPPGVHGEEQAACGLSRSTAWLGHYMEPRVQKLHRVTNGLLHRALGKEDIDTSFCIWAQLHVDT